jgi:hypothetical protein
MASLYALTNEFRQTIDEMFDEDGVMTPRFEELHEQISDKLSSIAAYILNTELEADQATVVIKRVTALRDAHKKKSERLKKYLADHMKAVGRTEILADDGSFKVKLYLNRDQSVVIEAGAHFPPELCEDPKPPEPSKSKIKQALLDGKEIKGASIVSKDRLTIK